MLNELALKYSGDQILTVLKIMSNEERYPVAVHCTAGRSVCLYEYVIIPSNDQAKTGRV